MTQTLLQLLEGAANQIEIYRQPDIREAQSRLNELLLAAELGTTGTDEITGIYISNDWVRIETRYSVRCCEQTGDYEFPANLLAAPDPLHAARVWRAESKLRTVEYKIVDYEECLAKCRDERLRLYDELFELKVKV